MIGRTLRSTHSRLSEHTLGRNSGTHTAKRAYLRNLPQIRQTIRYKCGRILCYSFIKRVRERECKMRARMHTKMRVGVATIKQYTDRIIQIVIKATLYMAVCVHQCMHTSACTTDRRRCVRKRARALLFVRAV